MKRIIIVLLCLLLVNGMISVSASASNNESVAENTAADNSGISETAESQTTQKNSASETQVNSANGIQENSGDETQVNTQTALKIDNRNVYEGMDKAYSKGYTPVVKKNKAIVILPLEPDGKQTVNEITASVELGATEQSPFIYKNYEKTIQKTSQKINSSDKTKEIFYVRFDLALSDDRINGVYPVVINISGKTEEGEILSESYTTYITIENGKKNDSGAEQAKDPVEEKPASAPMVLVSSSELNPKEPKAGDSFCANIILINTNETRAVQNMVVTLQYENEYFTLLEDSETIYISRMGAGERRELPVSFNVNRNAPEGDYIITVMMSYDDENANTITTQGAFSVPVKQELSIKLTLPQLAKNVTAGDTIPLDFQVMNLSRSTAYNVRCDIEGDGMVVAKEAFIGNLEAGTEGVATMNLFIDAKSETGGDEEKYGAAAGVIRLIYEDADGKEYSETYDVSTTIEKPVIVSTKEKPKEKDGRQWYGFAGVLAFIILTGGAMYGIAKRRV